MFPITVATLITRQALSTPIICLTIIVVYIGDVEPENYPIIRAPNAMTHNPAYGTMNL